MTKKYSAMQSKGLTTQIEVCLQKARALSEVNSSAHLFFRDNITPDPKCAVAVT